MKITKFRGINNVEPSERLQAGELIEATNVDVDVDGQVRRRDGFGLETVGDHRNLFDGRDFSLATKGAGGDLVNASTGTVLHAGFGHAPRVWHAELPDGRIVYSNGTAAGIASAASRTGLGVPIPTTIGSAAAGAGSLFPGTYRWAITHQRIEDQLEGGPLYSAPFDLATPGGITISGMNAPPAGHRTVVYLTTHNGEQFYRAGVTTSSLFAFAGPNEALQQLLLTDQLSPPPVGTLMAFWRGRLLVALGRYLFASQGQRWELFDLQRDVIQLPDPITLVQPVDSGIWVGTTSELAFLSGTVFRELQYGRVISGPVVLGSGVCVDGDQIGTGQGGRASRTAMVCIADRTIVAGFSDGGHRRLSELRYETDAEEVWATWRRVGGVPQYLASVRA